METKSYNAIVLNCIRSSPSAHSEDLHSNLSQALHLWSDPLQSKTYVPRNKWLKRHPCQSETNIKQLQSGRRRKTFFYVGNWKAFIKWLSLVKGFSPFISFAYFEEEHPFKVPSTAFCFVLGPLPETVDICKETNGCTSHPGRHSAFCFDVNIWNVSPVHSSAWESSNTNKTVSPFSLCEGVCINLKDMPLPSCEFTLLPV